MRKQITGKVGGNGSKINSTDIEFFRDKKGLNLSVMLKSWDVIENSEDYSYTFDAVDFTETGYSDGVVINNCVFDLMCDIKDPRSKYGFELDWIEWIEYEYFVENEQIEQTESNDEEPKIISAQEYMKIVKPSATYVKKIAAKTFDSYLKVYASNKLRLSLFIGNQYNPTTHDVSDPIEQSTADMIEKMLLQSGWKIHNSKFTQATDDASSYYELDIEAI